MTVLLTALLRAQLVALVAALLWKLNQLRRAPSDRRLWIVTLCVAAAVLAFGADTPSIARFLTSAGGAGAAKLAQNLLLFIVFYLLMVFFLYSNGARKRLRYEGLVLAAACAALTATLLLTPVSERGQVFSPHPSTSAAVFYLIGELYLGYASIVAVRASWRYAAITEPRAAWGLRIVAIALSVSFLTGPLTRTVAILLHWFGSAMPQPLASAAFAILTLSVVIFLVGITYAAAATRAVAWQRWRRHRRAYHLMHPLWALLQETFPEIVLHRGPRSARWERLSPIDVHRRHYRRAIECRDGLVLISPRLGAVPQHDMAQLAQDLRAALRAHAREGPAGGPARIIAAPSGPDLDADVAELVALADALRSGEPATGALAGLAELKG